jgi:hypothetical protein
MNCGLYRCRIEAMEEAYLRTGQHAFRHPGILLPVRGEGGIAGMMLSAWTLSKGDNDEGSGILRECEKKR